MDWLLTGEGGDRNCPVSLSLSKHCGVRYRWRQVFIPPVVLNYQFQLMFLYSMAHRDSKADGGHEAITYMTGKFEASQCPMSISNLYPSIMSSSHFYPIDDEEPSSSSCHTQRWRDHNVNYGSGSLTINNDHRVFQQTQRIQRFIQGTEEEEMEYEQV